MSEQKTKNLSNFQELGLLQKSVSEEQVKFIINTVAPTLNKNELMLFLYRAQKLGLDPLNGEIYSYVVKEKMGDSEIRRLVMIVSRDGKRVVAARTGELASAKSVPIYVRENKQVQPWEGGILWGATATVKRNDIKEPFTVTVPLSEYRLNRAIWKMKPETMIKKVAESQAYSMAFPELSGTYDEAETWTNGNGKGETVLQAQSDDVKPATDEQRTTITSLGGELPEKASRGEARQMIMELSSKKEGKNA